MGESNVGRTREHPLRNVELHESAPPKEVGHSRGVPESLDGSRLVRNACWADLGRVAQLQAHLYRVESPEMAPARDASLEVVLEMQLRREFQASKILVHTDDESGQINGCLSISPSGTPREKHNNLAFFRHAVKHMSLLQAVDSTLAQWRLSNLMCSTQPAGVAQLHSLAVDPKASGQGVARTLISAGEAVASEYGDQFIHLFVVGDNPLRDMYSKLGWIPAAQYASGVSRYSGLIMTKPLHSTAK